VPGRDFRSPLPSRTEDRRFDATDDLFKCLAFDAVVAWRVFDIHRLAHELLEPAEMELVQMMVHKLRRGEPIRPPPNQTMAEFIVNLGRLGGFRPSKRQPLPDTAILWKAMKRLMIVKHAINDHKEHWNAETSCYQTSELDVGN